MSAKAAPRRQQRALLLRVARQAMIDRGLRPDFPAAAMAEAEALDGPPGPAGGELRDLRELPWCSIDNDDSRDLDQLTVAAALPNGGARIFVAVADVTDAVPLGSALDEHARANTTSVYTPGGDFPMLPDRLSTDLTSLAPDQDRPATVVEIEVDAQGICGVSSVYRARVRNRAQLAYPSVGAWLEGAGEAPAALAAVPELAENLRLQDRAARSLKAQRHAQGALDLETIEVRARFDGDQVSGLAPQERNRARDLIEDFMIAANGAIARYLEERGFPVMRRVVRTPARWPRIVDIALDVGERLPAEADARALPALLGRRRDADPLHFPDLSLTVIKLLGRGEYVASFPGEATDGHFGLAVEDYTHSTAPNRRYPDLVTQRLVAAALAAATSPYPRDELVALAGHCTLRQNDVRKIERLMHKAAAACLLSGRIGKTFEGLVTGASPKGTWARIFDPPVEGRIERGWEDLDVGDRVRLKLVRADPERGYIDFARVNHERAGRRAT